MNRLLKKIDDIMVAITFAEAGELEEAARLAGEEAPAQPLEKEKKYDPTFEAA